MTEVEELFDANTIDAEKVTKACVAARGIYQWVMAVRNYFFVYKNSEPLRNKLIKADV
jgi:hypothetical protein